MKTMDGWKRMEIRSDIAIIGSGMAGLGCVSWLKRHFRGRVVCVSENGGASALSSGAIAPTAISPYLEHLPAEMSLERERAAMEPVGESVEEQGSRAGWQEELCDISGGLLSYRQQPYWLLDGWGRLYKTHLAQKTQIPGDLSRLYLKKTACRVGIAQFGDTTISPYPAEEYNRRFPWFQHAFVNVPLNVPLSNSIYTLAAELLYHPRIQHHIRSQLQEQEHGLDLLLFPCIFGAEEAPALLQTLQQGCSVTLAEMLGTSPSPPGLRWQQQSQHWLASSVAEHIHGQVVGVTKESDLILSLQVQQYPDNQQITIQSKSFVLASGNLVGGGLHQITPEICQEKIFNYPVFAPHAEYFGTQEVYASRRLIRQGIQVDSCCTPMLHNGEIPFRNLTAVGDVVNKFHRNRHSEEAEEQTLSMFLKRYGEEVEPIQTQGTMRGAFLQGQYAGFRTVHFLNQTKQKNTR